MAFSQSASVTMHSRLLFILLVFLLCGISHAQNEASTEDTTASNDETGVSVLGTFVIMLVIGVASYHVLAFTRIPYTAILIVRSLIPYLV